MEHAFGQDFSAIRIHEGPGALSVGALAVARGTNIHFAPGLYQPNSERGQQLLAHELTHVIQQASGRVHGTGSRAGMSVNNDRSLEREADEMGVRAARVERIRLPADNTRENSTEFRSRIREFHDAHPADSVRAGQQRVLGSRGAPVQMSQSAGVIQCYGSVAYEPNAWNKATGNAVTGKKTTNLSGHYGGFSVNHGLTVDPVANGGTGSYDISITMTPNEKTKGASKIMFLQSVRRGTTPGNWGTQAADPGMGADRARRAASGGWRVDRANPSKDQTPFYGHALAGGVLNSLGYANAGQYKGTNPQMQDTPAVSDPSVLEFSSKAMDPATGGSFGAVAWGFQYNSAQGIYMEETPRLLPGSTNWFLNLFSEDRRRVGGEHAAYEKWNEVYGPGGTGKVAGDASVQKVPGI
jgi:hypothetical protein